MEAIEIYSVFVYKGYTPGGITVPVIKYEQGVALGELEKMVLVEENILPIQYIQRSAEL